LSIQCAEGAAAARRRERPPAVSTSMVMYAYEALRCDGAHRADGPWTSPV
jgi:hypothetical protein